MVDPAFYWQPTSAPPDAVTNAPRPITPNFPPVNRFSGAGRELLRRIDSGIYVGRQTDWGAWVARVTKEQILSFVGECYDGDPTYSDGTWAPWLLEDYRRFRKAVESLDPEGLYALVYATL